MQLWPDLTVLLASNQLLNIMAQVVFGLLAPLLLILLVDKQMLYYWNDVDETNASTVVFVGASHSQTTKSHTQRTKFCTTNVNTYKCSFDKCY